MVAPASHEAYFFAAYWGLGGCPSQTSEGSIIISAILRSEEEGQAFAVNKNGNGNGNGKGIVQKALPKLDNS